MLHCIRLAAIHGILIGLFPLAMGMLHHKGMPHGGSVIRNGISGANGENSHTVEFSLKLDSNPEFTGSVLVAYARAVFRMSARGSSGCKTVFDVAPADLSRYSPEELRANML